MTSLVHVQDAYDARASGSGTARARQDLRKTSMLDHTPYGPIEKILSLGEEVPFICPFALLWTATQRSAAFGEFLLSCLAGAVGRLILFIDDCRPGNQLRPDQGRTYYAVFWSLQE